MNKLVNLALGAIVSASLLTSGCAVSVYTQRHVRPRVVYHEHPKNVPPILILEYGWPGYNCHYPNYYYDRYFLEFRYQNYHNQSAFQYAPNKPAFPHSPKAERRGSIKPQTEQAKESRRAFPKQERPKRHFP
ncbi:hypothetical protein HYT23_00105 [Candidatus Pacearchaeota archaeon]|nr:hypothetical protein [Candidatus Pacearchaeota archaeon]